MSEATEDQPLVRRAYETRTIAYSLPSKPVYGMTVNLVWVNGELESARVQFKGLQDVPWEDLEALAVWLPAVWQAELLRHAEESPRR